MPHFVFLQQSQTSHLHKIISLVHTPSLEKNDFAAKPPQFLSQASVPTPANHHGALPSVSPPSSNPTSHHVNLAHNPLIVQPKSAAAGKLPAIRACLFDMDGLLIDSEDKYTICTNRVLHEYGKPSLPWHIKAKLQGRRLYILPLSHSACVGDVLR